MEKEKQHPFDEFLKETLKGHQLVPREKARKAFLEDAASIRPARFGWFRWYYLPLLVVLISGIVATIYFAIPGENAPVTAGTLQNNTFDDQIKTKTPARGTVSPAVKSATEKNRTEPGEISYKGDEIPVPEIIETPEEAKADSLHVSVGITEPGVAFTTPMSNTPESKNDSNTVELPSINDTAVSDKIALKEPLSKKPGEPVKPEFAFGLMYLPEYMFNTVEGGKFVNNFGADFTFYKGLVSIRTGLGISVSEGITENEVEYSEYLGSYNKLDSITFIYNESSHDFSPNIHTSSEKVWDEISSYDSMEIVKRYTYLQVPLILGFDFWQKDRLSAGVRIGTMMSVMLKSRQLTGEYDPGENMVIGMDNLTPDRVSMNWQAIGALNATFRLNRRLLLELEPQAKYYYQSIYEKSGYEKKPWSLGLRTAILYKF